MEKILWQTCLCMGAAIFNNNLVKSEAKLGDFEYAMVHLALPHNWPLVNLAFVIVQYFHNIKFIIGLLRSEQMTEDP